MYERDDGYYLRLVRELALNPTESEHVEFKRNGTNPEGIGRDISALSNAAAIASKAFGYRIWGVDDESHDLVGTAFRYRQVRKGNQELESWLESMVHPKIGFEFHEVSDPEGRVFTVLEIPAASRVPTSFQSADYIRVGSNTVPLIKHRGMESQLWRALEGESEEMRAAAFDRSPSEVAELLDFRTYYRSIGLSGEHPLDKVMADLESEGFIRATDAGTWDITNLGALMIANDLGDFPSLMKRMVWVCQYEGDDRVQGIQERVFRKGYVASYEEVIQYVTAIIPRREALRNGVRETVLAFPEIAIRELVANMLVHQSLEVRGTSPMVEIFSNRIEFTNPGIPIVPIDRIVDYAPISRNERMAGFLHKCGYCEERGSGYDKIVDATSKSSLIAPKITLQDDRCTRVTLYAYLPLRRISKADRTWTCYMLACLKDQQGSAITNRDVRETFGLQPKRSPVATAILAQTVESGLIKLVDPDVGPRARSYVPYWADPETDADGMLRL